MNPTAYLLLFIDINEDPSKICGTGMFSEGTLTLPHRMRTVVALTGHGNNYGEGVKDIRRQLSHPINGWILNLMENTKNARGAT